MLKFTHANNLQPIYIAPEHITWFYYSGAMKALLLMDEATQILPVSGITTDELSEQIPTITLNETRLSKEGDILAHVSKKGIKSFAQDASTRLTHLLLSNKQVLVVRESPEIILEKLAGVI